MRPLAVAFLLTAIPAEAQQLSFVDSGQQLGNQQSTAVALGDVDGDGDLDAFVANYGFPVPGRNRLWINQGGAQGGTPGSFADSQQDLGDRNSEGVALGDVDGDGDLDAFVAHVLEGDRVWTNHGGVFSDSGQVLGSTQSRDVALGDLDGDGDLDAVVATPGFGEPDRTWINQGGAQAGTAGVFLPGPDLGALRSNAVVLLDVDADGDLDVMTATSSSPTGADNRLYINQGGAQGGTPGSFVDSLQVMGDRSTQALAVGDLDADGDLDAYAANSFQAAPDRIWINQGGAQGGTPGAFQAGVELFTGDSQGVDLGDVDGDGDLDAVIAKFNAFGTLGNEVWLNDGSGDFDDSGARLGNSRSRDVALGDLDGDGDLDLFVANGVDQGSNANRIWVNNRLAPSPPEADLVLDAQPQGGASVRLQNSFDPLPAGMSVDLTNLGPDPATGIRMRVLGPGTQMQGEHFDCTTTAEGLDCSLASLQVGDTASASLRRVESRQHRNGIYAGTSAIGVRISANESDPVPTSLRASRWVDYYDCATGCFIEHFFCLLNFASQGAGPRGTGWSLDLPVYYLLRQMMNFGPDGRRLVQRYNDHQAELWGLHEADPLLAADMQAVLAAWQPGLRALASGDGEAVTIDAAMVAGLDAMLVDLSQSGSPALAAAIAEERALIGPLHDLVGLTLRDAAEQLIPSDVLRVDGFERPETLTP